MSNFMAEAPEPPTELGRLRVLSPNAGIRVSPLALGAMSIGEAWAEAMGAMNKEQSYKLLDAFVESGGNFIDTANGYQDEQSEKWIGDWMKERGNREQIVLATKYTSDYQSHALGKGHTANFTGNHRRSLHVSIRDSLKKLGTDYIDILYLHWWDYTTSIKEIMDSLHILVEQGKVLYLGISDTPAWVVSAANTYAVDHGKTPFSVYQGRWSVMHRDFERDILPMAHTFGMALCPWDVLGSGKFQSKKALEERKKAGEGLRSFVSTGEQTEMEVKMSEALEKVAGEHGTESVTAIALAYVRSKAPNVIPIVGGRKVEHLKANIDALKIKLTDEQIAFLESVKPFDVGFPGNFLGPDPNITGKSFRLARASQMSFPNAGRQTSI
ncbi:aryl-alcohol dehydrogenase AAD14 [Colletotrichum abscissum]|uniref:Aldo-keto reductase ausK n=9 Tax=Colletotrichum acutatum species complex TaxID=2707335 RepID=A0A9P9XRU5_9PEZI|nr:aryl-alcohol dehydrogenase AAD14 [Colletotrichum lupini]XP_060308436.1 aryl-alcohol dehydrogenase AAD14 [Colletotrichum costaricense]XP_060373832.1 aryl-alcohol dehydrogenase AAD14 [Colletotrichum tamarilloi]XP_060403524.1 aryl-alcohol dehydrogenase AAD14 [Colletotrichum abscissum]KAI3548781.1 aryl-alcohol dehydrogenase AAD14 [Colletotrichum filicis]KAK0374370.1 aryl-alcohol dehydrogenase AAD14 [Colletotrichum limetticola]KAK1449243.1 aryl-alcohol dehydrogenase AAD14 [Colletotrichum meloni